MKAAKLLTMCGLFGLMAAAGISSAQSWDEENPSHEAQPQGALTGASIFVSAGHGWYWTDEKWTTQRGNSHGIIEDFSNAETVMQYFVKYLWNAGASVYTTRERCLNTNMVIIDNDDDSLILEGSWDQERADGAYDDDQLKIEVSLGEPTAFARFVPEIPEDGYYGVYVWYRPSTSGATAKSAHITINHTGGSTLWIQNQNHDGYTWKYIGDYYFEKGQSPQTGSVVISNEGEEEGAWVMADAVRFGGGMGDTIRDGAPSGKPRWEESGRYYVEFMGFDPEHDTRNFNTVGAMPMWSEWEMEDWEKGKSVYIGWHTNASGRGTSRGLFSFIYGPNPWDPLTSFTGYPKGIDLCRIVHDEIIVNVQANFDPEWRDGAKVTRWLGETNPRNNNKMPASLFEYGFHDNAEDAAYILDPQFRNTISKGTYQGIVKFYAEQMAGFNNATLLPEVPTNLAVVSADGGVRISWHAPPYGEAGMGDQAESYKVYRSRNGKGFDNGVAVDGTELLVSDLDPGELAYFRVAAVNTGGESFPSETLGIRNTSGEQERLLVVNGFDRLDRDLNIKLESGVERGILAHMNTFDYIIQHGEALDALSAGFDSTSNEAVIDGTVSMVDYDAVVWMLGQEDGDSTFDPDERRLVQEYLEGGGNILISGSEIAGDLAENDQAFLRNTLQARMESDNSDNWKVDGVLDSIFGGLQDIQFDDGTGNLYKVQTPDVIVPEGEAKAALTYTGTLKPAAIQYNGAYRLVYMAFPFETIRTKQDREEVMGRAIRFLLAGVPAQ